MELVRSLSDFAKSIGVRRTIDHLLKGVIPEIVEKEKHEVKKALIA